MIFPTPKKKCVRFEQEDEGKEKLAHLKDKEETYERFQVHQKIQDENILCASFASQKVLNGQSMLLFANWLYITLLFMSLELEKAIAILGTKLKENEELTKSAHSYEEYIKMIDNRGTVKHLLLYSDACPGQNKNKVVLAAIHLCLQKCTNISSIQMNYLLPGPSYMQLIQCTP